MLSVYVPGAIIRTSCGERPTTSATTASCQRSRRSAQLASPPPASATATAAAGEISAAAVNVDVCSIDDTVSSNSGKAARLGSVLPGGGSECGTPSSPRWAMKAV